MDTHARMTAEAGAISGHDARGCRKQVVADLKRGSAREDRAASHAIGVCSRCDTVVEPMLSYQWFVAVNAPMASRSRRSRRCARRHHLSSEVLGEHLLLLDAQHPGLVHLAPTVVGPSDPRLLVCAMRGRSSPRSGRRHAPSAAAATSAPGRGRARHLVLVGAVAVFDPRMARRYARPQTLLSDQPADDRLRHHFLLGRADDDVRARVHRTEVPFATSISRRWCATSSARR